MGLDIELHKLKKATEQDVKDRENYWEVDEDDEDFPKEILSKYSSKHIIQKKDFKRYQEENQIDDKNLVKMESLYKKEDNGTLGFYIVFHFKDKSTHSVKYSDIPTIDVEINTIGVESIGHQRKGVNEQFYIDINTGKINYIVFSKKELEKYKEKYVLEDKKEYFQKYIIDPFIDGECCVTFL